MTLSLQEFREASWRCLHFVDADDESGAVWDADAPDLTVFEIDGGSVHDKEQLLAAIARELEFPTYFGMNWDALDECLADMSWRPSGGYVLVLRCAEQLWRRNSRLVGSLVESWLFAAESWAKRGVPFHLVFVW